MRQNKFLHTSQWEEMVIYGSHGQEISMSSYYGLRF